MLPSYCTAKVWKYRISLLYQIKFFIILAVQYIMSKHVMSWRSPSLRHWTWATHRYVTINFYFCPNFLILTSLERTFKQKLYNAKILKIDEEIKKLWPKNDQKFWSKLYHWSQCKETIFVMPRDKYNPCSAYDSLNLKPVQELSTVPDCGVRMTKPRFILWCAQP